MRTRSQLAFPVAIVLTAAIAMLPAAWRVRWSRELGEIVAFPLVPFTDAGTTLAGWLRPPPTTAGGVRQEDQALLEQLVRDRDLAQRLYHAEHQRVLELAELNRQLQRIPADTRREASRLVAAHVTRRSPNSPLSPVELRLERAARAVVPAGTVAVYAGVYLLGRTVGESRSGRCALLPLGSRATGPLRGRVQRRDEPEKPLDESRRLDLLPGNGGTYTGAVSRAVELHEGDLVRLVDPAWPRAAQMMIVGTIASVKTSDREPLRNTVTVEPVYRVGGVAEVTLIVDAEEAADLAAARAEDVP